ncbi:MAG: flagellar biosynthetic protein FliQ [Planctomycetota bacterium]
MPYDESLVALVRETIMIALKIVMPILGAGVLIGLVVSIIQSVTSIQDQTLTFVPKIVVMMAVVILLAPWIFIRLIDFAAELLWLGNPTGVG